MASIFEEVDFIDGVQEFIESEYITELLDKGSNTFTLRGNPSIDSIRFSGDVSLFKKQVYDINDLSIPSSWMLLSSDDVNQIIINSDLVTSEYTFTYVTYKSKAKTKKEGLYSVDYDKGILYLSTGLKRTKISYKRAIQYVKGQQMEQVGKEEYDKTTVFNIPTDGDTRLSYVYQLKTAQIPIKTKEIVESPRVSLVTLGDKDD